MARIPNLWGKLCSGAQKGLRQSTNEVLMVAPTAFGFNAETAEDNSFMHSSVDSTQENDAAVPHRKQVLREFAGLHHQLSDVSEAPCSPTDDPL